MDNGFYMLVPVLWYTHPRHTASCALSMNAPTQEAGMNIIDTWESFKDHKRMQTVYEGSTFILTGESVVRSFIHNC
jgi:hypothetical protein